MRTKRKSNLDGLIQELPLVKQIEKAAKQRSQNKAEKKVALERGKIWKPESEPQLQALQTEAQEVLFGGQAGGGKTALLLIAAASHFYNAIIYRREYVRLKDIIKKSKRMLSSIKTARYNSIDKIWRGIPGGRELEFGAVQLEDSVEAWRGMEHDFVGFDELTEFTQTQYQFLTTWLRSPRDDVKCKVIATCNPPSNEQGAWIIEYWGAWLNPDHPNPAKHGEIRWYAVIDGEEKEVPDGTPIPHKGEKIIPRSRTFIPAKLSDNAYLDDGQYLSVLQRLPEPLRSQLLYGDFTIQKTPDHPWQVIPSDWVEAAFTRWEELDEITPGKSPAMQTHLGVDVARGGNNESVIASRHDFWVAPLIALPGTDTPTGDALAEQIVVARCSSNIEIRVDIGGPGSAVYDSLRRMGIPRSLIMAINGAKSTDRLDKNKVLRFLNLRAWLWWNFRQLLDPRNGHNIALPRDKKLKLDLCTPRWAVTQVKGKKEEVEVKIESKTEISKRIHGIAIDSTSPDRGEAVIYAFADVSNSFTGGFEWMNNL